MKKDRGVRTVTPAPVSAQVLARYQAQSRDLQRIRERSRDGLTVKGIVSILSDKKSEDLPASEKIIADLRSLESRCKGSFAAIIPNLLSVLKSLSREKVDDGRLSRVDSLLSYAILANKEKVQLSETDRANLFDRLEEDITQNSPSSGALLVLLSQVGTRRDVVRLEALRPKSKNVQTSFELSKLITQLHQVELADANTH